MNKRRNSKNKEIQSETGTRVQDPTDGKVSTVVTPYPTGT